MLERETFLNKKREREDWLDDVERRTGSHFPVESSRTAADESLVIYRYCHRGNRESTVVKKDEEKSKLGRSIRAARHCTAQIKVREKMDEAEREGVQSKSDCRRL